MKRLVCVLGLMLVFLLPLERRELVRAMVPAEPVQNVPALAPGGTTPPLDEVIVDDLDPGFQLHGPSDGWHHSRPGDTTWVVHAYWTYAKEAWQGPDRNNWATWTPNLPQPGRWEVFAFVPWVYTGWRDTSRAQYEVHSATEDKTVEVNQDRGTAEWATLGTFDFDAGTGGYVTLRDVTPDWMEQRQPKTMKFDAIKWVLREPREQRIYVPQTGTVRVSWISSSAYCPGTEFGLMIPGHLVIFTNYTTPHAPVEIGYFQQGDEIAFYIVPGGFCGRTRYESTDPNRARVIRLNDTTYRIAWEDDTDGDFNDLVVDITVMQPPACPGGSVDVVFAMDTSGSMDDEFDSLCSRIGDVATALQARGVNVRYRVLGINEPRACARESVAGLFPGRVNHQEDWGPAVYELARRYNWLPGATRLIIPMTDEGPQNGCPCNDPGDDRDAITEAIAAARANGIVVSPVIGTNDPGQCNAANAARVWTLANDLGNGTGGRAFRTADFPQIVIQALFGLIGSASCRPSINNVSPECGSAGTEVTIWGTNFASGATVDLCQGSTCVRGQVTSLGTTQIVFTMPSGLTPGIYDIVVTNPGGYQALWDGQFGVDVGTCPSGSCTVDRWRGEFFDSRDLSGAIVGYGCYDRLDFDWGNGPPIVYQGAVNADNFSARFTRTVHFDQARYHFSAQADNGVRVKVDGQEVINEMNDTPLWEYRGWKEMTAGDHEIVVEYMEATGDASLSFRWWQRKVIIVGGYGGLGWNAIGPWTWDDPYTPWVGWEEGDDSLIRYLVGEAGTPESQLIKDRLGLRWGDFKYFSYTGEYAGGQRCDVVSARDPGREGSCFRRPNHTNGDTCLGTHTPWPVENLSCSSTVDRFRDSVRYLSEIIDAYPDAQFDLISHSQGGVVAAFWVGDLSPADPILRQVHSIITIDSPVCGWSRCTGSSSQLVLPGLRNLRLSFPAGLLTIAAQAPQRVPVLNIANTGDVAVPAESAYFPTAWTKLITAIDTPDLVGHFPLPSEITKRRVGHTLIAGMVVSPNAGAKLEVGAAPFFQLWNIKLARPTYIGTRNHADFKARLDASGMSIVGVYDFPFDGWGRVGGQPPFPGDQLSYIAFSRPSLPTNTYDLRTQSPEHAYPRHGTIPSKTNAGDLQEESVRLLAARAAPQELQGGNIVFYVGTDRPSYLTTEPIHVAALLLGTSPVLNASVTAELASESGGPAMTLQLLDDGASGDELPNDGLYAGQYAGVTAAGTYQLSVSASGTYQGASFDLQEQRDLAIADNPAPSIDLSVSFIAPAEAYPGEAVTVQLALTNTGSLPATGVWLGMDVPTEMQYIADSRGSARFDTGYSIAWDIGEMRPGASESLTATLRMPATAGPGSTLLLEVFITSNNPDPVLTNSAAVATIYPRGSRIFLPLLLKNPPLRHAANTHSYVHPHTRERGDIARAFTELVQPSIGQER